MRGPRGIERGAFKAGGEEPPPGGVSVSAAAAAPRSPSPPPPSLALGARGCAALSGSRGPPARPPPAAPPRGPPLPSPPTSAPAKGKGFPRWAPLRAASGGVCSREDGRDPGWARGIFRLERTKTRWSPVLSGHPLGRLAARGFVPLASANSRQGCDWFGWLQALAFSL